MTTSLTSRDLTDILRLHRLLAIVRGNDPAAVVRTAVTLVECGIRLVEISLTGHDALKALDRTAHEVGNAGIIGAGTVLTAQDARRARDSGACFVVTPGLGPGVTQSFALDLPVLVGALTPTEVSAATTAAGCAAVKLFPASLGGADYLRALRQPFPHTPFVPVGGIGAAEARQLLHAGAIAVGVGSPLIGDAADGGCLTQLKDRASALLDAIGAPT
ncbi:bifunctional 4-hydroxy-2-oxoglutarate aldolase/2-dehydro-3-deoxy-phosphogluconate aldolase [Streptomyces sp. KR80]|uniref:bifunctional 4-hydroxy-2-oxoglutarate aldolase/2-dehydro-3-deoxy-phosphogluconate aldolase n=1 Tax=Streptomyces sp. KR80 TaxID=3457426 RepID=UPI003FD45EFC